MRNLFTAVVAASAALFCFQDAAAAQPGYLKNAPLNYTVPAPPTPGSEIARMDLVMVRAAQTTPASHEWQEADGDARAYSADVVIRRFEDSWGDSLSSDTRPILVFVLSRANPTRHRTRRKLVVPAATCLYGRRRSIIQGNEKHFISIYRHLGHIIDNRWAISH